MPPKTQLELDLERHLAASNRADDAHALLERALDELRGYRQSVDLQARIIAAADIPAAVHDRVSAEWASDTLGVVADAGATARPHLTVIDGGAS